MAADNGQRGLEHRKPQHPWYSLKLHEYHLALGTPNCGLKAIMLRRRCGSCPTVHGDRMLPVAEYLRTQDLVEDEVLVMIKLVETKRQFFSALTRKAAELFVSRDEITE
jgi:hypothetical protein